MCLFTCVDIYALASAYMPVCVCARAHACVYIRGQCRVSSTIILCFLRQTLSPDHQAPRFPLSTGIIGHASVPV